MIDDYPKQRLVQKYADENRYTMVANAPGFVEYVKYENAKNNIIILMKWSKGSDNIIISKNNIAKKYKINNLFLGL